jgi:outer membrane protein insertion porin family
MYKYFFLIYLLFLNLNVSAEIVKKIKITGNERISKETIQVYGEVKLNEDYSSFDLGKILKNLYGTDFFEDVKITLDNNILNIEVKEYPIINYIDLKGEKSNATTKKVLEQLQLKAKESFISSKLSEDLSEIKKIYSSIGYNFTTVDAKIEKFENNRINIVYFLERGEKTDINKINFIGDKKIKEKRLRDVIVSEEDKFWKFLSRNSTLNYNNIEMDKRLLINYYKSLGYYDVQVLSDSAEIKENNRTNLTYTINAGNRYKVIKISTGVSEVLEKKLFLPLEKSFTKIVGKYYSPFKVTKLLEELDLLISNNDLQFIEHSVNEILEGENIEIKINIYEGKKELVEKIIIKGNTVTDESVIRSELLLDEGDPFSALKLQKSIAKLKARNLFGVVQKKITNGENTNQKIIEILVEEKPTGEISAGAGVGSEGASFAFNITENNWLGKGVQIGTNIEVSAETFTGGFSLVEPNHNLTGNSLNYFIQNTTNDKPTSGFKNNIISSGIGTQFEQYRNVYLSPSLVYSYDDLKVNSSASNSLKKQKGTFSDLSLDYSIRLDNRDKVYAPTRGYISTFSQAVPIYSDSPYIKNTYSLSTYKSFSQDLLGSFKFFTSAINGLDDKDVRISKRIILPSSKLRGFEKGKVGPKDGNDYIGGNYAVVGNFELSLPNLLPESTKTDVGLFVDVGNLWGIDYADSLSDSSKIRSSAGINTSWNSPVGPMTFVFSKNLTKAKTDITESFNFRLGTTF